MPLTTIRSESGPPKCLKVISKCYWSTDPKTSTKLSIKRWRDYYLDCSCLSFCKNPVKWSDCRTIWPGVFISTVAKKGWKVKVIQATSEPSQLPNRQLYSSLFPELSEWLLFQKTSENWAFISTITVMMAPVKYGQGLCWNSVRAAVEPFPSCLFIHPAVVSSLLSRR